MASALEYHANHAPEIDEINIGSENILPAHQDFSLVPVFGIEVMHPVEASQECRLATILTDRSMK